MRKLIFNENWTEEEIEDLTKIFAILYFEGSTMGYVIKSTFEAEELSNIYTSITSDLYNKNVTKAIKVYLVELPNTSHIRALLDMAAYNGINGTETNYEAANDLLLYPDCKELKYWQGVAELQEGAKKRKKKPFNSMYFTTGDIDYNIKQFNKHMGTDFNNPSTEEAKAAEKADINSDINSDCTIGGTEASEAAFSENIKLGDNTMNNLTEAKRYIKRYYIRPQNIFCSNKAEILNALVKEVGDNNCSVYSLKSLADHDDVHLLQPKDIIYYYDEGILYDKNKVKVMDYDLNVKHEEERKRFGNVDAISDSTFDAEYEDRLTEALDSINEFALDFTDVNAYGEKLMEGKASEFTCCICGEDFEGYGNNPTPIKESGKCCDACNRKFVIPARLEQESE